MWTHRIVLVVIAVAAVVVASLAFWSAAAPALERPRTFSLLEVDRAFIPLGDFDFDRAPVGGDRFAETNDLYRWTGPKSKGTRVGRNRILVTFVIGHGAKYTHRATVLIEAQVYLPDGTLMIAGFGQVPAGGPHFFKLPVVGGTGVYDNARGYVDVRDVGNGTTGRSKIDFHLEP